MCNIWRRCAGGSFRGFSEPRPALSGSRTGSTLHRLKKIATRRDELIQKQRQQAVAERMALAAPKAEEPEPVAAGDAAE